MESKLSLDDRPTILALKKIKGRDGLNVIETIAANGYRTFGMHLLRDDNGLKIALLEKNSASTLETVERIVGEWLKQGPTLTYHYLINCLKESNMNTLAEDIIAFIGPPASPPPPASPIPSPPTETPLFKLTPSFKEAHQPLPPPPPSEESRRQAVIEFTTNVKVVIQTCNDAEYYAALEKLEPPRIENQEFTKSVKHPRSELRIVVGTFADLDAAVIKTEQGTKCQNELVAVFKSVCKSAKLLLGLGVCYGLKNNFAKRDLKLADVLVGKKIDEVLTPKLNPVTIETRGDVKTIPPALQNLFCEDADMWNYFIVSEEPSERIAKAFVGRLASGSILFDNPTIKKGLEEPALRYLGGEMEGWAQIEYAPKRVKCIIIKGIADFADGTKDKVWQLTAAKAAVDYAHYKLKEKKGHLEL